MIRDVCVCVCVYGLVSQPRARWYFLALYDGAVCEVVIIFPQVLCRPTGGKARLTEGTVDTLSLIGAYLLCRSSLGYTYVCICKFFCLSVEFIYAVRVNFLSFG